MESKKITVLVNKNWETEGVMASLVNTGLHPAGLPFPDKMYTPSYTEKTTNPRAEFSFNEGGENILQVKVRCIQDLMDSSKSGSSSEEKYRVLPDVLENDNPDLVISVSTAGYPSAVSRNGCVVVGGNFFIYDGHPGNPKSNLKHKDIGKLLPNNVNPKLYGLIGADFKNSVEPKFLKMPRNSCEQPICIASDVFTALSAINVTEYQEYNWVDEQAVECYKREEKCFPINSSETTHGVVKLCLSEPYTERPIIFVSPITDQFGQFDFDVTPTQNFAASFNSGIVVGQLLCELVKFVKDDNNFGL